MHIRGTSFRVFEIPKEVIIPVKDFRLTEELLDRDLYEDALQRLQFPGLI